MDQQRDEMAMLRFSLIAPAVNGTYAEPSTAAYYRAVSRKPVRLPDGGWQRFSPSTMAWWEFKYRHEGFEGLVWGSRRDLGATRSLTPEQRAQVDALRLEFPRAAATQIRLKMVERGLMDEGDASASTFQRYFRNNPAPAAEAAPSRDRRAFEAELPGDLWQADTMYGPWCAANFQRVLKRSGATWGIPRRLLVDNGGPYRNDQLTGICGRIGCVLSHAPVRDGAAKGKVERNFRTLRGRLLATLEDDPARTIGDLNDLLAAYVARHNATPHSALGGRAPAEVWDELCEGAPPRMPPSREWLDERFRNRAARRVNNDSTVRVRNVLYDVPAHLAGSRVELAYTPDDPSDMWVVGERGELVRLVPTDKAANARVPREAPRYRVDYGARGAGR